MKVPRPSPGHGRFEQLAGTWVGEEKMYPSQWDPKGGTAQGRTTSRLALNGFALIGDYEQQRGGAITFCGHSVWTFDPREEQYTLHWFDGLGSPPEVFHGRFAGDLLTMAHGGPGMHARLTYDLSERGVLLSSMAMSPDGTTWNTLFEGRYLRA